MYIYFLSDKQLPYVKSIPREIYLISFHSLTKERPINIPYHYHIDILNIQHFRRGVLFAWPRIYRCTYIIDQTNNYPA